MAINYKGAVRILDDNIKKEYLWHINKCGESNLSRAEYCRQNNLNKNTFSYLRGKLIKEQKLSTTNNTNGFTELKPNITPNKDNNSKNTFSIYINSDIRVELPFGLASNDYANIFRALGFIQ